jgi:hypothetical protein
MITYTEKRFFEWYEDDVSVTLRNKSGSYGGGIGGIRPYTDTVGALCARDYKGVGNQYAYEGKLVIQLVEDNNANDTTAVQQRDRHGHGDLPDP